MIHSHGQWARSSISIGSYYISIGAYYLWTASGKKSLTLTKTIYVLVDVVDINNIICKLSQN